MEPELLTAAGKPRCIGRKCGAQLKDLYPGAAIRYEETQCEEVCDATPGSTHCKRCKAKEDKFMAGQNKKTEYHGVIGGPIPPKSHIVGSEWNIAARAKNAAKAAAAALKDEAKAAKVAVKVFAEAESAAAAVAKAAVKERREAEATEKAAAKELREAAAAAKKREADEKRAATAAAKAAKAAAAVEKQAAVAEKRVDAFADQLSGRLGWAQIGHRPFLPTALMPYSSSNGVKGYQARPGSARRTSSGARRTSSGARRTSSSRNSLGRFSSGVPRSSSSARRSNAARMGSAAAAIQRAFRTRKAGRNARGRFTSSSSRRTSSNRGAAAAPGRRSSSVRRSNAAKAIQRGYRNFMTRKAAVAPPAMSIVAAAPAAKSSSSSEAVNMPNLFAMLNGSNNGPVPELD